MIKDVQKLQEKVENKEMALQPIVEKAAVTAYEKNPELAREYLTDYCNSNAEAVFRNWWKLGDSLFVKYQNGFLIEGKSFSNAGYNDEWLKKVGFKPITYEKSVPAEVKELKTAGGNPEK
jgi:dipeptidase